MIGSPYPDGRYSVRVTTDRSTLPFDRNRANDHPRHCSRRIHIIKTEIAAWWWCSNTAKTCMAPAAAATISHRNASLARTAMTMSTITPILASDTLVSGVNHRRRHRRAAPAGNRNSTMPSRAPTVARTLDSSLARLCLIERHRHLRRHHPCAKRSRTTCFVIGYSTIRIPAGVLAHAPTPSPSPRPLRSVCSDISQAK